ncbi:multicopper oxidase family protein [Streptomyces sp. YIM 98790]|uniref:multicopper oxidase family protein n=1 Tax=Streptomyces sp. YIM 98790 TaxID=2689077 RepID=UPI00140A47D8|nr:multicopper oxidase domain-containing protein [Streptomyces sp. YIM 98790]
MGRIARREVLKAASAAAGTAVLGTAGHAAAAPVPLRRSTAADDFPQPQVRRSRDGLLATQLDVRFAHNDIPGVGPVWTRTYDGTIPGPTLRVRPGERLEIAQVNGLPPNELRPPADTNTPHHLNSFNLHTHGLHVDPSGTADNVFREFPPAAAPGLPAPVHHSRIDIPDDHPAGTFWYHPHHHGSTAVQILGGMAGVIIIEGDVDRVPEIAAARDVTVCVSELKLAHGQVPDVTSEHVLPRTPSTFLVNGKLNPTITLESGEVQRWRLVNAGGVTVLRVTLDDHPLHRIAQDGITLEKPTAESTVTLPMGGRADILVRGGKPGTYRLTSAGVPHPLMTAVVTEPRHAPMGLPQTLPGRRTALPEPGGRRHLDFRTYDNVFTGAFTSAFRILGTGETPHADPSAGVGDRRWGRFDPHFVNHTVRLGDVEEWVLKNSSRHDIHPFHMHTNHFLVMSVNGQPLHPPVWRDTVGIRQGGEVVIRVRFQDFTGRSVVHCHNLRHGDQGMMQVIEYTR